MVGDLPVNRASQIVVGVVDPLAHDPLIRVAIRVLRQTLEAEAVEIVVLEQRGVVPPASSTPPGSLAPLGSVPRPRRCQPGRTGRSSGGRLRPSCYVAARSDARLPGGVEIVEGRDVAFLVLLRVT